MSTDPAGHEVSLGQEALWFLQKLAPASPAYNVAMAVRILQPVDDEVLRRAAAAVAERHELLRSRFAEHDGRPRRITVEALPGLLEVRELPDASEERLHALARQAVDRPFDLAEAGPVRLLLLRRSAQDAVLVLVTHHAVTDGASQVLVLEDLLTAYQAYREGLAEPAWPAIAHPYQEYVDAERELVDSPRREELAAHWRTLCADAPATLELPTDRPRPPRKRFAGATWDFRLPAELAGTLRPAAAAAGVTPFVLLFSAFQALLHRWTAQPDFLVGYAVSCRPERTMRHTAGYFVNTLPCRADFAAEPTFRRLMERTAEQLRQGLAHRELPLPLLPGELDLAHDPSRTPVFQSMFSLITATRFQPLLAALAPEDGAKPELLHHGLRLTGFDLPQQEGQFDLSAEVLQSDGAVKVAFKYDTDLFDAATVGRMAAHYRQLLAAAVADPDLVVRRVPLVDAAERETLLSFAVADW